MKPIDLISDLIAQERLEEDWRPELKKINIYENVAPIYLRFPGKQTKANIILAYIVLAYSQGSTWLNLHRDRNDNKHDIMSSIAGILYKDDLDYIQAIVGQMDPYNAVIEWLLNYQTDHRWKSVVSGLEFHSKAQVMARSAEDGKTMIEMEKLLTSADERLETTLDLIQKINSENVTLDSALKKEGRAPMSDRGTETINFMSHEERLKKRLEEKTGRPLVRGDEFFNDNDELVDRYDEDQEEY